MKKILVLNAGSSSMKFMLFNRENLEIVCEGIAERIGVDGNFKMSIGKDKVEFKHDFPDHKVASSVLVTELKKNNVIESFDEIVGIGHRVVQGGEIFKKSSLIYDKEIAQIEELSKLAPLHNPGAAAVIKAFNTIIKDAKNVAVFDTSFHQTMPKINYVYGVPYEWYEKFSVRKYGAHGTSHKYIAQRVSEIMNKKDMNVISCHLGNGASIAAIKNGECINTSMGLTPLGGIIMGTRSGDLDPSIIGFIANELKIDAAEVIKLLNNESGVKGLSKVSSDFRDIRAAADEGNKQAQFTLELYANIFADFITRYQNDLENKVDAVVFTAGIGENSGEIREMILKHLHTLDFELDKDINLTRTKEDFLKISTNKSKTNIYMIKTNEELMIAKDLIAIANL